MTRVNLALICAMSAVLATAGSATAQDRTAGGEGYKVEWVYRVRYGHQDEWWRIFRTYQIAILDREKQLGYVRDYIVQRPGLHVSEESRWDYRIIITYADPAGATHEAQVEHELFPDQAALKRDEQTRWELTLNHWDLPIHDIDPHAAAD